MLLGLCAWALVSPLPFPCCRCINHSFLEYTDIADRAHGATGEMGLIAQRLREIKKFWFLVRISDLRNYVYTFPAPTTGRPTYEAHARMLL